MTTSNTYRRGKSTASKTPHTRWEMTYGIIAARLLRKGNIRLENAFAVAKFLGFFVYLFSFPYSAIKKATVQRKIRKKLAKSR